MSEHIQNYLGNQNTITVVSGTTQYPAVIGQNLVVGTSGLTTVVTIADDLYKSGREFSIIDYGGTSADENIVVSGSSSATINGASTYTLNTAYETQSFITTGSDAWIAPNTRV